MGCFVRGCKNGLGCYVRGDKNSMGCYVRGDKKSMGCYVRGGKSLWDVLSGMSKNGMRCFVRGCFVWLPMIEVRSVSHAAWAHCRTGKSFEILIREGRRGSVSRIT